MATLLQHMEFEERKYSMPRRLDITIRGSASRKNRRLNHKKTGQMRCKNHKKVGDQMGGQSVFQNT